MTKNEESETNDEGKEGRNERRVHRVILIDRQVRVLGLGDADRCLHANRASCVYVPCLRLATRPTHCKFCSWICRLVTRYRTTMVLHINLGKVMNRYGGICSWNSIGRAQARASRTWWHHSRVWALIIPRRHGMLRSEYGNELTTNRHDCTRMTTALNRNRDDPNIWRSSKRDRREIAAWDSIGSAFKRNDDITSKLGRCISRWSVKHGWRFSENCKL